MAETVNQTMDARRAARDFESQAKEIGTNFYHGYAFILQNQSLWIRAYADALQTMSQQLTQMR